MIRPYVASPQDKEVVRKEIEKLVKQGVIEEGPSDYTSPIMLLSKPGTRQKKCVVDLRYLNSKVRKHNMAVPLVKHAIQTLGNSECTVLSKIDLKSAFYALRLSKRCQKYTGISTFHGHGTYRFQCLPMGLKISGSVFACKINEFLSEIPDYRSFCIVIADDLCVYSKDKESHFKHLAAILDMLKRKGLRLSLRKAELFRDRIIYMGHKILISDGRPCITPMRDKCEAIARLSPPRNARQVKQFCGAINFLSMYLPDLKTLLKPLYSLTKKHAKFKWENVHQTNFDNIKTLIQKEPVLTMPRKHGIIRLYTDSSQMGTGGAIFQVQDGIERLLG